MAVRDSVRTVVLGVTVATALCGALTAVLLAPDRPGAVSESVVLLVDAVYLVVAVVVCRARPGHWVGIWALAGAWALGVGEGLVALGEQGAASPPSGAQAVALAVGSGLRAAAWMTLAGLLPLVFPDGRVFGSARRRRWSFFVATAGLTLLLVGSLAAPFEVDTKFTGSSSPWGLTPRADAAFGALAGVGLVLVLMTMLTAAAGLVGRWRKGDALLRQQLLWITLAFIPPVMLVLAMAVLPVQGAWMFGLALLPIPIAIAVAMLQHRLYDVQLVASRTLTWITLSAALALLYAITIGGVGALLRDRGDAWLPWLAAGALAVSFAPLRNTLQAGINRLVYGGWAEPADVLAASGRRLAEASDVPTVLRIIATDLGQGLGLGFVSIDDATGRPLATYGHEAPSVDEIPLTAYGLPVGALRLSGRRLRESDRRLLNDLAGQLGGLVHSYHLVDQLRVAQERLVAAGEEERKRLRRDLHDGLGPSLAGLSLQVDTIRNHAAAGVADLDPQLLALRSGIQGTVADVRRIVEGLRPPALDELGLVGAVDQLAQHLAVNSDMGIELSCGAVGELPAAVEVAAYRVTQEALTNAVTHSRATTCSVAMSRAVDHLLVRVQDNGTGVVTPRAGGMGLHSMNDRAVELGGRLDLLAVAGVGTTVTAFLPVAPHAIGGGS